MATDCSRTITIAMSYDEPGTLASVNKILDAFMYDARRSVEELMIHEPTAVAILTENGITVSGVS